LHEVAYLKGLQNADIANLIKQDYRNKKTELFNDGSHSIAYHHERIYIDGSEVNRDELSVVLKAIGLSPYYQSLLKQINSIDHCLTEVYCDSAPIFIDYTLCHLQGHSHKNMLVFFRVFFFNAFGYT
jgi:hypothetical protein